MCRVHAASTVSCRRSSVRSRGGLAVFANERWVWQVKTRTIVEGPLLEVCPTLSDIGIDARSVRRHSHIHLTNDQDRRAEYLLGESKARGRSTKDSDR